MATEQTRRRRKRYQAGSAYAGDVKPTGFLGVLGSRRTMIIVFVVMALALVAGGVVGVFTQLGLGGSNTQKNQQGFVLPPDDENGTPTAEATPSFTVYEAPPAMTIDVTKSYTATIKTELGDIQVELLPSQAPETVNNFVFLAQDDFYDGLVFHYVLQGFEALAGDPTCKDLGESCRKTGGPGYDLTEKVSGEYSAGTLGMANGSQFFIALTGSDQFSEFTPFGRVVSGLSVAEALTEGTKIESVEIQQG